MAATVPKIENSLTSGHEVLSVLKQIKEDWKK